MNNFKDGLILNVKQERENKNKCKDAYEKQLSELEDAPIDDNDSDYEINNNNDTLTSITSSEILIKTNESIYVVYTMSQYAEFMLMRVIIKTENDDGNEQIIKYAITYPIGLKWQVIQLGMNTVLLIKCFLLYLCYKFK